MMTNFLPQANNPHRIVQFINQSFQESDYGLFISNWDLTRRQLMYYKDAANILGFINISKGQSLKEWFELDKVNKYTTKGLDFLSENNVNQLRIMKEQILSNDILSLYNKKKSEKNTTESDIERFFMEKYSLSKVTVKRRFSTIKKWNEFSQQNDVLEEKLIISGLKQTIKYYFEMYFKDIEKVPYLKKEYYKALSLEFGRTTKYYERRMGNISYVIVEHYKINHLNGLKPLFGAGTNVSNDIISIIDNEGYIDKIISINNRQLQLLSINEVADALNDDISEKTVIERKIRKGQLKFRNNLLEIYNNSCAISDCNVINALEAAHIQKHSVSGINSTSNGILLRSDLHKLFDSNLLKINPNTLLVELSDLIKSSSYYEFEGRKLRKDKFGNYPDLNFLSIKYNEG